MPAVPAYNTSEADTSTRRKMFYALRREKKKNGCALR